MTKKQYYMFGIFAVCFMLTGCCMSHEWKEATCTEPKTCAKCGKSEGEALGHTWVGATCAEAKHCSVCGEIEGEPLEHTWANATCVEAKHCSVCGETEGEPLEHVLTEANYQQPAICEVCGETVGEPLQAAFEKNGIECNAESDTTYPIVMPCYGMTEYTTEGKLTFSDYEIFESDDTHEALEDYEWRTVTTTIIFDDENARNYGFLGFTLQVTDYYGTGDTSPNTDTYTLNYNGIDYTDAKCEKEELQVGWNDDIYTCQVRYFFRVPKGYDGTVVTVLKSDSAGDTNASITDKIDNDTVFFRLK